MSDFTEAEVRFIEASIPVLVAGEAERVAHEQFEQASVDAEAAARELGEDSKNIHYMNRLIHEAASRGGFGPDSEVVKAIEMAFDDVQQYLALLDQAAKAALAQQADGNPVV